MMRAGRVLAVALVPVVDVEVCESPAGWQAASKTHETSAAANERCDPMVLKAPLLLSLVLFAVDVDERPILGR